MGRYKAGAGNIIDLLNAQASLANARFQRVQSQYNWSIAKAQLAQAIGRLDLAEISAEIPDSMTARDPRPD
jgi:outer membrane protein TolC